MNETMSSGYRQTYDRWRADPQAFWAEAAREIAWIKPPERIFDPRGGVYGRWFPDARCNACFNALDRHVEAGRGGQTALYYDSPVTDTKRSITYRQLLDETATLAAVLHELGVAETCARHVGSQPLAPYRLLRTSAQGADAGHAYDASDSERQFYAGRRLQELPGVCLVSSSG